MDTQNDQQLTRKGWKELRRLEKSQFQMELRKKRTILKITAWVIVILIIGGSGYGLYYLANQSEKSRPGESIPILGQEHIQNGASHLPYNSNPLTSGWHYAQSADWGMYQDELPDEQLVHNLEHGGIWISYKDIDERTNSDLEAISKRYLKSIVITKRAANDAKIVLASWGRLEKLDSFDEAKIIDFIKANRNKSPEPLAR